MTPTFTPTTQARGLVPAKVRTVPVHPVPAPVRDGWLIMLHVVVVAICLAIPAAVAIHAVAARLEHPSDALVWSQDAARVPPALRRAG